MRISTIATPLESNPKITDVKLGSTSFKALFITFEQGKADKEDKSLLPITAMYLCLPQSRHHRVLENFLKDSANTNNPPLGIKLNCLSEKLEDYKFNTYTGPRADDPDATATETWYRAMTTFKQPGSEQLVDFVVMHGEVDVVALSAWGKRTIATSDNSQLRKKIVKDGKEIREISSAQFSVCNMQTNYQNIILFSEGKLVTQTVDRLPEWSVVAIEGRLRKSVKGLAFFADTLIPIKVEDKRTDTGEMDSSNPEVRTNTYTQASSFGSVEDY